MEEVQEETGWTRFLMRPLLLFRPTADVLAFIRQLWIEEAEEVAFHYQLHETL